MNKYVVGIGGGALALGLFAWAAAPAEVSANQAFCETDDAGLGQIIDAGTGEAFLQDTDGQYVVDGAGRPVFSGAIQVDVESGTCTTFDENTGPVAKYTLRT